MPSSTKLRPAAEADLERIWEIFHATQFNFVVSTNTPAVRLWQKLGFEGVGVLPQAFRHTVLGLVDVYVMYRLLA